MMGVSRVIAIKTWWFAVLGCGGLAQLGPFQAHSYPSPQVSQASEIQEPVVNSLGDERVTEKKDDSSSTVFTYELPKETDLQKLSGLDVVMCIDSTDAVEGYYIDLFSVGDAKKLNRTATLGEHSVVKPLKKGEKPKIYPRASPPEKAWRLNAMASVNSTSVGKLLPARKIDRRRTSSCTLRKSRHE